MLSKEKSTEDLDNSKKSSNFAGNLDFSQENGYFSIKMTYMTSKTTYSLLQKAYTIVLMLILSWGLAMPAHCQRSNTDTSDQSELSELEDGSKLLFERFEQRFIALDSLIFDTTASVNHHDNNHIGNALFIANSDTLLYAKQDSLVNEQVAAEVRAMKHETGLSLTGQTYYRLDEGLALDEDDAVSRYKAKVQVELRWNFLNSSLIHRQGRKQAIELQGDMERIEMDKANLARLLAENQEYYQQKYDSLLSGILQHRLMGNQIIVLEDIADRCITDFILLVVGSACNLVIIQPDFSAVDFVQAANGIKQCGFPAAGWSQESYQPFFL